MFNSINGLFLPGGGVDFNTQHQYWNELTTFYSLALKVRGFIVVIISLIIVPPHPFIVLMYTNRQTKLETISQFGVHVWDSKRYASSKHKT